jgi:LysR family transcriptional regulator (chromosome initiation inhibitor)
MRFDSDQLETLVAVIDEGTFEAGARRLHVTPSAVSQRVRALESAAGQVLVCRTTPTSVTAAGEPVLRLGRQLRLLADETAASLGAAVALNLAVAVNADSLSTWFRPVLSAVGERQRTALRLHIEDQGYSHDLLRMGEVMAAVTSEPRPVQGCVLDTLGSLRYIPAAAPSLVARFRHGSAVEWSAIPMVVFNEKDHLQDLVLAAHRANRPPVVHRIPSTNDFHDAVRRGLGWGMIPEPHLEPDVAAGALAKLPGARPADVPLYWQRWRIDSPALNALTGDVRRAAAAVLRPPAEGRGR